MASGSTLGFGFVIFVSGREQKKNRANHRCPLSAEAARGEVGGGGGEAGGGGFEEQKREGIRGRCLGDTREL